MTNGDMQREKLAMMGPIQCWEPVLTLFQIRNRETPIKERKKKRERVEITQLQSEGGQRLFILGKSETESFGTYCLSTPETEVFALELGEEEEGESMRMRTGRKGRIRTAPISRVEC